MVAGVVYMVRVNGKNLELNKEEAALLGESREKEFELIPNDKGIFLLIDRALLGKSEGKKFCVNVPEKKKPDELEENAQQVLGLVRKGKLSDLVEGKFEETLNEKQRKALLQLVATGKVFVFKLNETYKKGVYRVKEETVEEAQREKKESEDFNAPEKPYDRYTLDADGFLIIKGKDQAANASQEFGKQIKEGLLRGIKSFDGNYYLIQNDLLQAYIKKLITCFGNKNTLTNEELAKTLDASKMLSRIICEFLKEEGELLERKKGQYSYIK